MARADARGRALSLGVGELLRRLQGVEALPEATQLARNVLAGACVLAWTFGSATLATQRRPERRVGSLASLHGALALSALVAAMSPSPRNAFAGLGGDGWAAWTAHLVLASTAAGALARFLPASPRPGDPAVVLFRRHPWTAAAACYGWLSLAGAPFTPGALLWLLVARALIATHHPGLVLALALAWTTALAVWWASCGARSRCPPRVRCRASRTVAGARRAVGERRGTRRAGHRLAGRPRVSAVTRRCPPARTRTGRWEGVGAPPWNRTRNLLIKSQLLCQLS